MRGCTWVGNIVVGLSLWAGGSAAAGDRALDKPAFTAAPSELVALGKAAPAGDWPVIILRDETDVSFDDQGRATTRWRWVFVVRTQAGVDDWGTLHAQWRPYHQNKPVVRVRVIDAAGGVAELDPALVTDAPATQKSPNVFSDLRHVDAPLPRLQIGAVVEEQIVTTDREPLSPAGAVDTTTIGNDVPTSSTVISYSAPVSRKLHHVERKLPAGVRPRHRVANGRESWVYEIPALPAQDDIELAMPSDIVRRPYVGVGTGASWVAVARGYRAQLEQRIADGPFALPAELPRTASIETVNAIAAWLHQHVRYTGIEFGEASSIPWPPAETAKRGFGDCKDKAALLIAMLRQAGVVADLALLEAGPGYDIDPDLPGLLGTGAFDHAIVRARVGTRDVWIDATEDLVRPGALPARDQGRRVLVIAEDTKGLSTTPSAAPADNMIRELRTFVVAEAGAAQLTEVERSTGVYEGEVRDWMRDARAADIKKDFSEYAGSTYGGTLDRVTSSDAQDLGTPFERTVVINGARRVFTDREQIDAYLYPRSALQQVPSVASDKPATPRTSDFAWHIPHVYEVENRLVVPPGFTLPEASPPRTRPIGPATFTETRRVDGQTLIVTFRFETGKPRMTAAELATMQAALHDLGDEEVHIRIEHTALALSGAGKPREAIAECARLIALHPKEPIHHAQLATVLMRAGAGEAARREARKAVALAPADADPQAVLGWVLTHDTLGRQYTYDWDRAGAIAALQNAHKVDPAHIGAAVSLAEVLERDRFGRAFESGADLRAATEARRAVLALEKSDENALALAHVLVRAGEFAEAERVARTAKQTDERDKWIVAAIAARDGAKAAIKAAGDLRSGASRGQVIDVAASVMMVLGNYPVARELLAETGILSRMPAPWASVVAKVTNHPPVTPGSADPRTAVLDLFMALVDRHRKTPVFWDEALETSSRTTIARLLPPSFKNAGAVRFLGDLVQASTTIQIEGDAGSWRASVDANGQRTQIYLALDRGIVKMVGGSDALDALGRYVLRTSRSPPSAAEDARARRLLDWARSDTDRATSTTALAFRKLWGPGLPTSREAILLAAAVLSDATDPDRAIAVGSRCGSTLPDAELICHELLLDAHAARAHWADAVAQIEAILLLRPDRAAALVRPRAWALAQAGRFDEAEHQADDVLAKDPDHRDAMIARFMAAAMRGTIPEALRRSEAIVKHPNVTPIELNNIAWFRLGTGSDLAVALELARKATDQAKKSHHCVSTLAAIEAELGELSRAVAHNRTAIELRGATEPSPADWYIVGRIDEQLGLADDAAAAYKRVARTGEWMTSHTLAQKRLAAMRRAP